MLITRWNEASRALPVLALKSNYLDRWPNDCMLDLETKLSAVFCKAAIPWPLFSNVVKLDAGILLE